MQTLRKHPLAAAGIAAALLFTAACSSSSSDSGSDGDSTKTEDASGTVISVCSDMPYEPFEFDGDGPRGLPVTGFDIELLDAAVEVNGDTLEVQDSDFDTIFASVNAGNCDIVASAVTITEEREENSLFSEPYFDADQSLLVPADSDVTKLGDLAGETIGVQTGTTGETFANENTPDGATIKAFPDASGLFAAINSGELAAVLQDLPVNSDRANKDDTVKVVATFPTGEQYGFAMAKENTELQAQINEGLAEVRENGTYDKLFDKYFPIDG